MKGFAKISVLGFEYKLHILDNLNQNFCDYDKNHIRISV